MNIRKDFEVKMFITDVTDIDEQKRIQMMDIRIGYMKMFGLWPLMYLKGEARSSCFHFFITGVIDSGDKFITGVSEIVNKYVYYWCQLHR